MGRRYSVYLQDGLEPEDAKVVVERLKRMKGVHSVVYEPEVDPNQIDMFGDFETLDNEYKELRP